MKKHILLISILSTSFVFAQNEQPAELNTKDLIEVNKPEFDDDDVNIDLDVFIPKMEMPLLVPQTESADEIAKTVNEQKPEKAQPVETKPVEKQAPDEKGKTAEIINASTALTIQQLKTNDLIRIEFSQIKIYRRENGNIVKYKFRNGLDLKSSGLNKKDDTTYYVKNTKTLMDDTKVAKEKKNQLAKANNQEKVKNEIIEISSDTNDAEALMALRENVEEKLNNGKKIKDELQLKNLRTNDLVYVIGDVLLVTRKNKATSGTKKFWLTEAIDVNHKALEKEANNRYKVLRKIQ